MSNAVLDPSLMRLGPAEFRLFRELIHRHTGIWLRDGKEVMLASRLSRRLREHQMSSFADYYQYVERTQDHGQELEELINCVTTNKTAFFREQHHFTFLAETVLPQILLPRPGLRAPAAESASRPAVEIWSAASSTGEEAYSVAMTLHEWRLKNRAGAWDMRILASDIDTTVLGKAVRGIYDEEEIAELDEEMWKKYFLRGKDEMAGQVKVKKELARAVEFRRINLMDATWPVDGSFDVIFFRNALIYFRQETQDRFLRRMARHLKPGGYLFLGHSEHIPWLHDVFEPLQKTIYRLRSPR